LNEQPLGRTAGMSGEPLPTIFYNHERRAVSIVSSSETGKQEMVSYSMICKRGCSSNESTAEDLVSKKMSRQHEGIVERNNRYLCSYFPFFRDSSTRSCILLVEISRKSDNTWRTMFEDTYESYCLSA